MKRLRKDCGGFTLVEIMVTFTLTAIFMGSAALVLSAFMRSHTVASAVATEQNVASIVMETVSSNLGAARWDAGVFTEDFNPEGDTAPAPPEGTEDEKEKYMLLIDSVDGNSVVWYVDGETGNAVKMSVKKTGESGEGYLALDYYVKPEESAEAGAVWEHVPWQLGEGVYQHCSIESFKVEQLPVSGDSGSIANSCLSVTIVLKNGIAGSDNSFTLNRTFDCRNLAPENIQVLGP